MGLEKGNAARLDAGGASEAVVLAGNGSEYSNPRLERLLAEIGTARRAFTAAHRRRLRELEVPDAALYGLPMWGGCGGHYGAALVRFDGRYYEPADDGEPALVLGLFDMVPSWGVCDALAINPTSGRFGVRLGEVPVAGLAVLDYCRTVNAPCTIFGNPMAWLRAGGEGVLILDWSGPLLHVLDGCELAGADVDTAKRLRDKLQRDAHIPPIRVRRSA